MYAGHFSPSMGSPRIPRVLVTGAGVIKGISLVGLFLKNKS